MEQTCSYCKYRQQEQTNDQSCSKWVKGGDLNQPCDKNGLGENPGETDHNCSLINCPSYCQFPFPKNVYNESLNQFYGVNNQVLPSLKDNNTLLNQYISSATTESNLDDDLKNPYNRSNKPQNLNLKCGKLATPKAGQELNPPSLPTASNLREAIQEGGSVSLTGVDWSSIKNTEALRQIGATITGNTVTINGNQVPLSNNGIELEWWNSQYSDEELKNILPESMRSYQDLESIHLSTGGVLENVFPEHNVNNMVVEEVSDWLRKRDIQILNEQGFVPPTTGSILSIASLFGVDSDSATNREFEECMNNLMRTDHNDDEFMQRINSYQHISDLGKPNNRDDLLYVESKILRFLTIDPIEVGECLDLVYLTDTICTKGLSSNTLQLLGIMLHMDTNETTDDTHVKVVTHRLMKYVPDLLHKMIDISEYYEQQSCQKITHNTQLLREMYMDLFVKNRTMNFVFPDFGLGNFFKDFQSNIITKTILLLVFAYLFTHILALFKINYNINDINK
tara:strand:- start:1469 stop:2995 length:1527 start_codon:yes stop_codon:yes gene_type:complete